MRGVLFACVLVGLGTGGARSAASAVGPRAPLAARRATQEPRDRTRIDLIVRSRTLQSLFVDAGRFEGLLIDDRVTFFPPGEPLAYGIVRQLSAHHARVELEDPSRAIAVGTPGEAWIPTPPTPKPTDGKSEDDAADPQEPANESERSRESGASELHTDPVPPDLGPLWRSPPIEWASDRPLLSEGEHKADAARPAHLRGRWNLSANWRASGQDAHLRSTFLRSSLSWTLDNPFAAGGRMRFAGDAFYRRSLGAEGEPSDGDGRLRTFSYEQPGGIDRPQRWIVGRYASPAFPEFGWVDGFEWAHRVDEQSELGGSLGHVPELPGDLELDDSTQATLFFRQLASHERPLDWRIGYQKTWSGQQADRDLFVLDGNYRQSKGAYYSASAWLDHNREADSSKPAGIELTRLFLRAGHVFGVEGRWGVSYSEFRQPQLSEFSSDADSPLADADRADRRVGVDLSGRLSERTRYRSRLDNWNSEGADRSDVISGQFGLTLEEFLLRGTDLELSFYGSHAGSGSPAGSSDLGTVRADLHSRGGLQFWSAGAECTASSSRPLESERFTDWQTQVHASLQFQPAQSWSLSLGGEAGWGDFGKTLNLHAYLQWSF